MDRDRQGPPGTQSFPTGPGAVAVAALLTWALPSVPLPGDSPLRALVGLGFLFVGPGYAFLWMLDGKGLGLLPTSEHRSTVDEPLERFVFAVVTSLVIAIGVVFVVDASPAPVTGLAVRTIVVTLTIVFLFVGTVHRWRSSTNAPEDPDWPSVNDLRSLRNTRLANLDGHAILTVTMLGLTVVAVVASGLLITHSTTDFTEVALLEAGPNGEYVAVGTTDRPTEGNSVVVRITNHARNTRSYLLVAAVERVHSVNGTLTTTTERRLREWRLTVGAKASQSVEHQLPNVTDDAPLRIAYRLYVGNGTSAQTIDTGGRPDQHLHVWMNETKPPVTPPSEVTD